MDVDLLFGVGIKLICLYVGFQIIHGVLILLNSVMQSVYPPPMVPASKKPKKEWEPERPTPY
jgi:hypothetical protein|tara:strand:+ start:1303 stop:1488 length:186 start_codon:yes stop_codon:yes gene_type:complete